VSGRQSADELKQWTSDVLFNNKHTMSEHLLVSPGRRTTDDRVLSIRGESVCYAACAGYRHRTVAQVRAPFSCDTHFSIHRYAYNQIMRICEQFFYTGKGGNQNNFLSRADCEATCPVLDNPCSAGMPATLADGSAQLCSPQQQNVCSTGYWCHVGATASTTLCCPGGE
jgi:hypothetical protein